MLFPYRWTPLSPSFALKNIRNAWWVLTHGIGNVVKWAPVVWDDVHWDESALLRVLQYKFQHMATAMANGHHLGGDREAKRLRVCAELCKRLNKDEYFENAGYKSSEAFNKLPDYRCRQIINHSVKMQKQDQRYLGLIIGKYLCHWWD